MTPSRDTTATQHVRGYAVGVKPSLNIATSQQLVLTPQVRLAIRLLQLSSLELEAEIAEAVASNPLLDWVEDGGGDDVDGGSKADTADLADTPDRTQEPSTDADAAVNHELDPWPDHGSHGSTFDGTTEADQAAAEDSLLDHLLWQLHLGHFSPRDTRIGVALIDAIDDDGYLREDLAALAASLLPDLDTTVEEMLPVLHRIQYFDPLGVGARSVSECLHVQLRALSADTPGREHALVIACHQLDRLPKIGVDGIAAQLGCSPTEAQVAVSLLQSLDPHPGARFGSLPSGNYVRTDCVIWRHLGLWQVGLAAEARPNVGLQRDYQRLIRLTSGADADYLRGHLQEARWLLKAIESRADTLLRVVRCLVREQSGFLEFGPQALHPLTLREVAAELDLHESTVSRAVAGKFAHTPRGTLPLRAFFASGIGTDAGGSASSTAIQDRIRKLVANEDPRKPLSDAKLADTLKKEGVPVARRTVAKYREALQIPASHERVRVGTASAPQSPGMPPIVEGGHDANRSLRPADGRHAGPAQLRRDPL